MPSIIRTNRVGSESDFDFWKINLPTQERRHKYSGGLPINILSGGGSSIQSQPGMSIRSAFKQFQ